jgi:hypothetical protein
MNTNPEKLTSEFAKIMTAACVRRGFLEKLHAGITPSLEPVIIPMSK